MASKKKAKTKTIFVLHATGEQYDVIAETGKYYICNGTQFRKSGNRGVIREVALNDKVAEAEPKEAEAGTMSAETETE